MTFPTPLASEVLVFRSIKRWDQLTEDGFPNATAFHRRPTDDTGMSVDYNVAVPAGCGTAINNKKAVLRLVVGEIRALGHGLNVIANEPTHADIDTGVPIYDPNDGSESRLLAEVIAASLASISTVEWIKSRPQQT